MAIHFVLVVNKQGQTKFSKYIKNVPVEERPTLESGVTRKCLYRNRQQCAFLEYADYKIVYRRFASLFFLVATDPSEVVKRLYNSNLAE